MSEKNKVFRLQGKVQHYAWGGSAFLPQLLSIANPENKPFAEYWMGAHDNAPSELLLQDHVPVKLNEYIAAAPRETLGGYVAGAFGRLPYLFKILDVKDMLSIQVHPSKQHAEAEFAAENKKGIPLTAAHRNYKDDNHKPELMLALSEFWLLHGFKPEDDLLRILQSTPELAFLAPVFRQQGYQGLYMTVMEMEQSEVNSVLQPLLDRVIPAYQGHRLSRNREDFWAARAALTFNEGDKIDRGIFSIYLFNLLNLHPGEAIFQGAGMPHAYLEGQNVEIMANSDNVLRGGLTPKHVDVAELLKHVKFEATHPHIIPGDKAGLSILRFPTPAPDFELSEIRLVKGDQASILSQSIEIFIVLEGRVVVAEVSDPTDEGKMTGHFFNRGRGDAFVVFDGGKVELRAQEDAVLYRAAVPVRK